MSQEDKTEARTAWERAEARALTNLDQAPIGGIAPNQDSRSCSLAAQIIRELQAEQNKPTLRA